MLKRFLNSSIKEALEDTPVILITGARQSGKSTFCKQLIENNFFEAPSVTMDDPTLLNAAKNDPMGFLLDMGKNMIIDEIQRVPELFLSLKKLVDDDRSRRIILTGSADVMLMPEVGDSLAGRIESHSL